jgi:hypothetical protein
LHDIVLTADHHAVASLEPEHAAARADVDVMNISRGQCLRTTDVIDVVRVAAVDQDVAWIEMRQQLVDGLVHEGDWHHEPQRTGLIEFPDQLAERSCTDRTVPGVFLDCFRCHVEDDAAVTAFEQTAHHVAAHAAQTNHAELHH